MTEAGGTRGIREEVSLAIIGSGGAGVMTAGELLLAMAAQCGLYGFMTKSYGPQIRGGESACFLRLGFVPFEKPADRIDLLAALDFRNADRFEEELCLAPDARVLYEEAEGPPSLESLKTSNRIPIGWKALASRLLGGQGRPNILALGVLVHLIGIPEQFGLQAIGERWGEKGQALLAESERTFKAGINWARQTWGKRPFELPQSADSPSRWVLNGNEGIVLGALAAGCDFCAGYPITPASDILEGLSRHLPRWDGVVIQAEDELAAVNMAIGASFGGKKAMTATSGPGFSLMAEGLGLALMVEIPLVVADIQRAGPSTGIPTKTEQSDLWAALGSSHGDNPRVVLAPSSVRGCAEMTARAFDLAEAYQVPVILLSDQFLANGTQAVDPFPLEGVKVRRRQLAEDIKDVSYRRFRLSDGKIAPMTVPGMPGGEYTAEGLEHDEQGWPDASHGMHQRQAERRLRKLDPLTLEEGWIEECGDRESKTVLIGWGSTGGTIREAVSVARKEGHTVKGIIPHLLFPPQTDLMNRLLEGIEALYVASCPPWHSFSITCGLFIGFLQR